MVSTQNDVAKRFDNSNSITALRHENIKAYFA